MVWAPPRLAVGGKGQGAGCFLQSHEDLLLSPGPLRQIWAWETQCQPCRCVPRNPVWPGRKHKSPALSDKALYPFTIKSPPAAGPVLVRDRVDAALLFLARQTAGEAVLRLRGQSQGWVAYYTA